MVRFNGLFIAVSAAVLVAALPGCRDRRNASQADGAECVADTLDTVPGQAQVFDPDLYDLKEGKVRRGEFFADLLMKLGMGTQDAYNLSASCDTAFDVRTLGELKLFFERLSVLEIRGFRGQSDFPS